MKRIAILVVLVFAAPAQGQEFSGTTSLETLRHPDTREVTWRLRISTGDQPFSRELTLWAMSRSDRPGMFGIGPGNSFALLDIRGSEVRLEGPGEMTVAPQRRPTHCALLEPTLPTFGLPYRHGTYDPHLDEVTVSLPAHSESTIVVPADVQADAPWEGTRVEFAVSHNTIKWNEWFHRTEVPLEAARWGVPIGYETEPQSSEPVCTDSPPEHAPGTEIVLRGRTDPKLAGQAMTMMAGAPGDAQARAVAETPVAEDGTFVFTGYRPTQPGLHAVAVRYRSQRPEYADDFAPPRVFRIREPQPPASPPAPAAPAVTLAGRPVVRGRTVTVPLRCTPGADACAGVVRIRRAGRRVAARRFALAPAAVARVGLRIPRATARTLRRRGRLAVRVELQLDGGAPVPHAVTLRRR